MKVFHILKKGNQDTEFRGILLKALSTIHAKKLEEKATVYLASGFFDEIVNPPRGPISAFQDKTVKLNLQNALSGVTIKLFGAYNDKKGLLGFGSAIKNNVSSISAFYKYRFHAKIFIIEIVNRPVLEIIGSSNMTVAAYEGVRYTKKGNQLFSLNYECDLVLVDDDFAVDIKPNENISRFSYSDKDNNGITLQDRAEEILRHIKSLEQEMKNVTSEL